MRWGLVLLTILRPWPAVNEVVVAPLRPHRFFLCFASGARDLGAGFEKNTHTPPYVHVHPVHVCCDILWFNREVRVVMGAVDDNMQAPHTLH